MRYTLTAALPYTNGPIHIGHLAGVYIPADIFARFLRAKGDDVLLVCGSDEHGVPITIRAQKEGLTPQQVVDKYHHIILESFEEFGISFDIYHRTSDPLHHETAQLFFEELHKKDVFLLQNSEQFFDAENNQFLADRYITGTCPKCQNPNAYGDQCEKCGSTLAPDELINPKSALNGKDLVKKTTKHWFLPLNKYQERLEKWILTDHKNWKINVYGQCKSWLKSPDGLLPRAVTRDLNWGVKVPLPDAENKVLYVWFDAPIGYISATKAWAAQHKKDWELYWKSPDTTLIHFIGKDNIVFHCIVFPAMLMAHGGFILPENVPANEFLNLEGEKISTSRNHAVWLNEYLADFDQKQDELRYVLTSIAPETKDSDFTWSDFQQRINSELVAILGNFVNRVVVLTHKFFDGKIPENAELANTSPENERILQLYHAHFAAANQTIKNIYTNLENYRFREAQNEFMNLSRQGNKLLADTEPWKLIKTNAPAVAAIISYAIELLANIGVAAQPFLPKTAQKIFEQLNYSPTTEQIKSFWDKKELQTLLPQNTSHSINEPKLLFALIDDDAVNIQKEKLANTKISNQPTPTESFLPLKPDIAFEDFSKLDIRTATITAAETIPKADRLLKLTVNTGIDVRTIVSGIAKHFSPQEVVGKQVSVLMNLPPRTLKGVDSQGMILMAADASGKLFFVNASAPEGSIVS